MSVVARPMEVATLLAWTFPGEIHAIGSDVIVGTEEVAVFIDLDEGRVLGFLGPGRHRLDPATVPFVVGCLDPGGTMLRVGVVFVSKTLSFEVAEIGRLRDADGNDVYLKVASRLRANVIDPARFALQVMTQGTAGIPAYIGRTFMADLTRTIGARSTETRSPIAEVARGVGPDDESDAIEAAAASFGGFLQIISDGPFYIDVKGGGAPQEDVFEMMWDCRHCGKKKLLGLTHRFCANCGAPQDASGRYFPPDDQKVAVRNHEYSGSDVSCPACRHWNSRNAHCCVHCGGPLHEGVEVVRQNDVVVPVGAASAKMAVSKTRGAEPPPAAGTAPAATPPKKNKIVGFVIALFVIALFGVLGLVCTCIFWKRAGHFEVSDRSWQRTIEIERFAQVRSSTWCSDLPSTAREISRRKETKSTTRVKDGEDCSKRKKDLGNGTFKEVRECTPRYKETPVYADKCEYEAPAWTSSRKANTEGGATSSPEWPKTNLAQTGTCIGCEREGKRDEKYVVKFSDVKTKEAATCTTSIDRWKQFEKGTRWNGEVGVLSGAIDCGSLTKL